jgi:hypothetical protein
MIPPENDGHMLRIDLIGLVVCYGCGVCGRDAWGSGQKDGYTGEKARFRNHLHPTRLDPAITPDSPMSVFQPRPYTAAVALSLIGIKTQHISRPHRDCNLASWL